MNHWRVCCFWFSDDEVNYAKAQQNRDNCPHGNWLTVQADQTKLINHQANHISQTCLKSNGAQSPFQITHFTFNGTNSRKTWGTKQIENQERISCQATIIQLQGCFKATNVAAVVQDTKCGNHCFFGC